MDDWRGRDGADRAHAAQPWEPPPRQALFRPARGLSLAAKVLTAATMTAHVLAAVTAWWVAVTPRPYGIDDYWDPRLPIATADVADLVTTLLVALTLLASSVVGVVWLWRVRANAEQMAAVPHRRGRVWVWLSWVLPVVQLWFPYQVVADVVRTSDPDLDPLALSARRTTPGWVRWWWAAYLLSFVSSIVNSALYNADPLPLDLLVPVAVTMTLTAFGTLWSGTLWIQAVSTVTREQDARAARGDRELPGWVLRH